MRTFRKFQKIVGKTIRFPKLSYWYQTFARLSSRSWNWDSQGKLSSHSQPRLLLLLWELSFHSQLSFSNSQKFETSKLNLVDFSGNFSNMSLQFWCFNYRDFSMNSHKRCTLSLNQTPNLEIWKSHSQFQSHFSCQNSHSQLSNIPWEHTWG